MDIRSLCGGSSAFLAPLEGSVVSMGSSVSMATPSVPRRRPGLPHGLGAGLATGPLASGSDAEAERTRGARDLSRVLRRRIVAALYQRQVLLVLDDVDEPLMYLPRRLRALLSRLLERAPGVSVLATSRSPLGLGGSVCGPEKDYVLPPLPDVHAAELLVQASPAGERVLRSIPAQRVHKARLALQAAAAKGAPSPAVTAFQTPASAARAARLAALALHPVLRQLCGHPQAVCLAARMVGSGQQSLDELQALTAPARHSGSGRAGARSHLWPAASLDVWGAAGGGEGEGPGESSAHAAAPRDGGSSAGRLGHAAAAAGSTHASSGAGGEHQPGAVRSDGHRACPSDSDDEPPVPDATLVSLAMASGHAPALLTAGGDDPTRASLPVLLSHPPPGGRGAEAALGTGAGGGGAAASGSAGDTGAADRRVAEMAPAGRAALLSMELLVASVAATDGRALALLTLISMFPAGLSHTDLDIIWGAHGPVFASAPADAVQEMADRNADALRAAGIPVGGRGTAGHGITDKDELTATEGQRSDGDDDLEGGTDAGFSGADSNATAWEDGASACDAADRMSLNSYCRPGAAFASGLSPPPLPHHRHRSVRARRPTPSMGGSHTGQPGGSSAMHGSVVASLDGGTAISSLMDTSWGRFPANASAVAGSAASLDATSVAISARWAVTREGVFASVLGRTAARKDWSGRLRALVDASAVRRRTVSGRSPLAAALDCWALWVVGSEAVEESLTRLKLVSGSGAGTGAAGCGAAGAGGVPGFGLGLAAGCTSLGGGTAPAAATGRSWQEGAVDHVGGAHAEQEAAARLAAAEAEAAAARARRTAQRRVRERLGAEARRNAPHGTRGPAGGAGPQDIALGQFDEGSIQTRGTGGGDRGAGGAHEASGSARGGIARLLSRKQGLSSVRLVVDTFPLFGNALEAILREVETAHEAGFADLGALSLGREASAGSCTDDAETQATAHTEECSTLAPRSPLACPGGGKPLVELAIDGHQERWAVEQSANGAAGGSSPSRRSLGDSPPIDEASESEAGSLEPRSSGSDGAAQPAELQAAEGSETGPPSPCGSRVAAVPVDSPARGSPPAAVPAALTLSRSAGQRQDAQRTPVAGHAVSSALSSSTLRASDSLRLRASNSMPATASPPSAPASHGSPTGSRSSAGRSPARATGAAGKWMRQGQAPQPPPSPGRLSASGGRRHTVSDASAAGSLLPRPRRLSKQPGVLGGASQAGTDSPSLSKASGGATSLASRAQGSLLAAPLSARSADARRSTRLRSSKQASGNAGPGGSPVRVAGAGTLPGFGGGADRGGRQSRNRATAHAAAQKTSSVASARNSRVSARQRSGPTRSGAGAGNTAPGSREPSTSVVPAGSSSSSRRGRTPSPSSVSSSVLHRHVAPPQLPYNTTPPSLPLMWLLASRADVASLSDGLPYLEAGTLDAFAGATGLPPAPGRSTAEAAGSALPSGPAYGHGHGHLPPTAAYVSLRLDRQASARQLARCLAAAQLNPACIPSAYPRTRALRLELLLRACVHFHASAEFVQACLAVDTAASRRHAATLTRATVHHVLCVLDMAAALTELCVTAEDQRAALLRRTGNGAKGGAPADSEAAADGPAPLGSSSGARAERHLPMLDERFIACCREGLHHAALAGATLSSAMLELGMDPGQALDVATASLRLFGVRVDWHPEAALELRRGRHRSVWRVADVLRLNLALACSRKAAGLALAATGQVARARQQLMGARMLFNAAHSGSRHAAAAASVLVAMGLHSSDQGDVRMARRCLAEALDTYRVGFSPGPLSRGGSRAGDARSSIDPAVGAAQASTATAAGTAAAAGTGADAGGGASGSRASEPGAQAVMPGAASAVAYQLALVTGSVAGKSAEAARLLAESRRLHGELRQLQSRLVRALGVSTVAATMATAAAAPVPQDGTQDTAHSAIGAAGQPSAQGLSAAVSTNRTGSEGPSLAPFPPGASEAGAGVFGSRRDPSHSTAGRVCTAARRLAMWIPPCMAPAGNIALAGPTVRHSSSSVAPADRSGSARTRRLSTRAVGLVPDAAAYARVPSQASNFSAGSHQSPAGTPSVKRGAPSRERGVSGFQPRNKAVVSSADAAVAQAGPRGVGGRQRHEALERTRRQTTQQRRLQYAAQVKALNKA